MISRIHINTLAQPVNSVPFDFETNDRWPIQELGLLPNYGNGHYYLSFNFISIPWLKTVSKKFIRLQAATKSGGSCRVYISALRQFNAFLCTLSGIPTAEMINRKMILDYIQYLSTSNLSTGTRRVLLIHLRTFHQLVVQEEWLPWTYQQLIYASDLPKDDEGIPKFIPEIVISQLQEHLHHLPTYAQHLIRILLETGRRISEVCSLPLNCLEQDSDGDWLLKVRESKFKKTYLLPISADCYNAIIMQRKNVLEGPNYLDNPYLFPARKKLSKSQYVSNRTINTCLNVLAGTYKVLDENQQQWHFHTHQFRHTVGTRMINAGVTQTMVQKYLGHESPKMTARYAHIHDKTLKAAFNAYQGKMVDIHGQSDKLSDDYQNAAWLKKNIMSQALPNGLCALPVQQQRCPHANACLSCANFRTDRKHLPQHKAQLEQTINFIGQAKLQGLTRQVEMNESVKVNLERIISGLEGAVSE